MRFNAKEMTQIERTMDKLMSVALTVWDRECTDATHARCIAYIIGEMRICAGLVASDDRATRVAGFDRLDDLLKASQG